MCSPFVIQSALASVSRREALRVTAGLFAGALTCVSRGVAADRPTEKRTLAADNVLDLTHVLSPAFPIWPGGVPIKLTNTATLAKEGYYANKWELVEHHGTHLDAPAHFAPNGGTAERLEASSLIVPAAVIDIRERARKDADSVVTIDDLKAWEKAHGRLPKNCGVFLNSGWDAKAGDARAFLGQDDSKTLHFPGFSKEACEFLLAEREIAGLAVDTLSLDFGASKDFAVHKLWLGAGKWGLECVANLAKLPPAGATVFVGAPKVVGASGGPTRVLAVWG
ncbi:MAG TPA: cyclase family protein [Gemmataceae bacterium]|nr:cyclase family protein [Gemmataceae bacterium]